MKELLEELQRALAQVGEHKVDYRNVVRREDGDVLTLVLDGHVEVLLGLEVVLEFLLRSF